MKLLAPALSLAAGLGLVLSLGSTTPATATSAAPVVAALGDAVARAEAEMGDEGRVLVRPSGTEPLVRVMIEHLDAATAERICDELVAETQRLVG